MVMHASKYPRLNDGYYDRNKSHQYEDKYPSKNHGYSERYNDRHDSPSSGRRGSSREDSPHNRYHNKASYMDRNRERLQKGSSSSPADRRVNHNSSSHGDDRHGTDRRPGNDKKLSSSKSSRKDKPDIQKSALRICGDWSEHLSSKGKKYYYNIISEDSKWEKPKEWHDSQARYTDYGMHKEKQRQNGREQSKHHSSNKYDDKHSRTHSGSSSSATVSAEKRDSQQRLVKSFSTPVGAPVSSSPATSTSHSHHPPASSSSSSSRSHHHHHHHPERANSMYSSSSSSGSASHRLHQNDSSAHARTIYSSASCGEDSRTSKSSGYDKHSSLDSRDRDRDRREDMLSRRGSGGQRDGPYESRGSSSSYRGDHHRADRDRGPPPHHHSQHHHHARKDSVNSGYNDSASNGARSVDIYRNDNEDSRQTEDMDISPGSTPSNSRPGSRPSSRISTPITSTPGASATTKGGGVNATSGGSIEKSPSGKQDGQNLTQTIQQLQILQKVLMVQQQLQKQQQQQQPTPQQQSVHSSHHHHHHHSSSSTHHHRLNTSVEGDHSPVSEGTPTYEPQHLPPWESGAGGGGILNLPGGGHADHERAAGNAGKHSPRSDCSVRSRKSSPSRSEAGSHGNGGGTMQQQPGISSLAAAAKKQSTAPLSLTPSLSNYYNENLVEHVQGWPSDTVEKQGNHYAQEGHLVGSQHCTQVSVELKRARSLVRIAEIQSTLQEQRVLFLKQQIADLERSQNTYMPPSSSDT